MHDHGILNIPNFIANAGGVICAAVEYHGGTEQQALAEIAEKIRVNTSDMLERMKHADIPQREAALQLARTRRRGNWLSPTLTGSSA